MQNRISGNLTIILVLFAVCFDLSQAFLEWILIGVVINPILDIGVGFMFNMVLKSYGVNFKGTIALVFFGLAFLEFFPVIDEFPLWTIDIIAVIILTKAEDKLASKVGSGRAGEMMRDPARLRRMGKLVMNKINKVPMLKNAMDKKIEESSEKQKNLAQQNNTTADQKEDNSSPEKMRWQSQNKQKNSAQSQKLGSGSKENIKKDDSDNKRLEVVKQQREAKQNRVDRSNNEEYENKDKKDSTPNQDYNKQKTFRFDNDFGRQNDSGRPQSERDIIDRQRQAKSNRPQLKYIKNNNDREFKKAA